MVEEVPGITGRIADADISTLIIRDSMRQEMLLPANAAAITVINQHRRIMTDWGKAGSISVHLIRHQHTDSNETTIDTYR